MPPPSATPPSRVRAGFTAISHSIWFAVSLVLYTIGATLRLAGNALVRFSGWERRDQTGVR